MQITAVLVRVGAGLPALSRQSAPRPAMLSRLFVCVALGAIVGSGPIRAQISSSAPVQYIDHIMIRTDDPESLFAFFDDTLQLPIAWPLENRNGVVSGGVGFGNVNIEAINFPGQINEPEATHLVGLALEPGSLDESLAELRRRGIAYGAPRPFVAVGPDGVRMTSFTNVTLQDFSDADLPGQATMQVFLSAYNPTYVDAVERRGRLRNELAAKQGGPLGLIRVQEVTLGTADLPAANRDWERLVAPTTSLDGTLWRIGDGPAVRLVQAERPMIQGIVLAVASLSTAREFLQEKQLLGASSETELVILPAQIRGLDIRLVSGP
jgi:catechol 2,3-dioxygenase-like lactoylglutathione lyase family enzyme